jgi:chromosome segregation ATPase
VAAGLAQEQLEDLKTAKSASEEKLLNATARIENLKADISASDENLQKATARIKHLEEVTKHAQKQLEDLKTAKSTSNKELESLREHIEKFLKTIEQIIEDFTKEVTGLTERPRKQARQDDLGSLPSSSIVSFFIRTSRILQLVAVLRCPRRPRPRLRNYM